MSRLTKNEVANYIRNLIPYLENPVILAPKGCFEGTQNVSAGSVIEYEVSLLPTAPKVLEQQENLKVLVELYKSIQEVE